jgi:hypothetical protein
MSAAAKPTAIVVGEGPSLRSKIAAAAVLLALAALAYYAMFSGPTKVPVSAPAGGAAHPAKQAPRGEPGEEGERGD